MSPRFRAKLLAHAHSIRFTHAGLCSNPQPNSHSDSERSDQNHSQSNPDSNSDCHSDTHAVVTRTEYHPNAYANSNVCGCLAGWQTCQLLRVVA